MANKDDLCKKLNKGKPTGIDKLEEDAPGAGCVFYSRIKKQPLSYESYGFKTPVWDIEELLTAFKKKRVSPLPFTNEFLCLF
jgi:hypothetical protein